MKYTLFVFALLLTIFSCNLDKDRKLSEQERRELEKAHADSVLVIVDSLNKTSIYVPPLYDKETFDSTTTIKFYELAKASQGELKLLVNSKLISTEIIDILNSYGENNADLLILMDKTGSMADDIENVRKGLKQIIEKLKSFNNVRLAIALYGDKNEDGPDWFSFKNFETNYSKAQQFVDGIEITGGGDWPESVYEGFFKACDQNFWRSGNKRMIILIGDAPPLEKPYSKYEVSDLIKKADEGNIKMNFYPIVVTPAEEELPRGSTPKTFEKEKIISSLSPNPASVLINVALSTNYTYSVEIFNSSGALISTENFTGNTWRKDVSGFQNGAYILRVIRKDKKFETIKFIVYR